LQKPARTTNWIAAVPDLPWKMGGMLKNKLSEMLKIDMVIGLLKLPTSGGS